MGIHHQQKKDEQANSKKKRQSIVVIFLSLSFGNSPFHLLAIFISIMTASFFILYFT